MKRIVKRLTSLARMTRRILLQFRRIPRRHWRRPDNAGEELLSGARAAQEESLFVVAADAVVASEVDAVVASEVDAAVASEADAAAASEADAVAASGVDAVAASEVDEVEAEETEHISAAIHL
jgi:hypothetical protein